MSEHPAHRAQDRLSDGLAKGVNAPETSSGSTGFRSQNRFTDPATEVPQDLAPPTPPTGLPLRSTPPAPAPGAVD